MTMSTADTVQPEIAAPCGLRVLGPLAGALWFLGLATFYGAGLMAAVRVASPSGGFVVWAPILSRGCTVGFFLIQATLMMTRRATVARREGLAPWTVSLLGTYGVWAMAFLPETQLTPALAAGSASITLLGSVMILWTILHLGRSFSIAPQARTLITSGPYRLVRHPLYVAEEIALIGVAMHFDWRVASTFLVGHLAMQLSRMRYEEGLLRSVFPEYAAYARRTARWIPGVC
jgi:protein-S-isoprenylcysteine O-methyltransferase Ste14